MDELKPETPLDGEILPNQPPNSNRFILTENHVNIPHPAKEVTYMCIDSRDKKFLAYVTKGGVTGLVNCSKARKECLPLASSNGTGLRTLTSCTFLPFDTGMLATGCLNSSVEIWDTRTLTLSITSSFHGFPVHSLSFSSTQPLLAVGGKNGTMSIYDVRIQSFVHSFKGHLHTVQSLLWEGLDDHTIISGSADGTVRVWDNRWQGAVFCLDGEAGAYNDASGKSGERAIRTKGDWADPTGAAVRCAQANPSGILSMGLFDLSLVVLGRDRRVQLWDVFSNQNELMRPERMQSGTMIQTRMLRAEIALPRGIDGTADFMNKEVEVSSVNMGYCSRTNTQYVDIPFEDVGSATLAHFRNCSSCVVYEDRKRPNIVPLLFTGGFDTLINIWDLPS
ncbi:hypothetical protein BLNAU_13205 [Blattamonas nauphoetae]|uniref:Uncharacterized protein n=1 Tax=Blattamonas nauphoetae TaxID=2049346 RepID=A0ABQ9XNK9_9EUKA|nr:hypothetical protein BLNAU_13205 [Blattamonas nauphoetae]